MKKVSILGALVGAFVSAMGQDPYRPEHEIKLRAPAYPIVTSDPYFSIWSPNDALYEGATVHWTGEEHPLIGAIRVDGQVYRFLGKPEKTLETVVPNGHQAAWAATYTTRQPEDGWERPEFDDSQWRKGEGAFGTSDQPRVNTRWNTSDIWVRRTFDLEDNFSAAEELILQYSHDDVFSLFINGTQVVETDYSWNFDVKLPLSRQVRKLLRPGKNVIAIHCHNTTGGGYVDVGLFRDPGIDDGFGRVAEQVAVNVLPTQTYYTFACGPVKLDLVFTAPLLLDDLDLVSTPINYVSYRVRPTDNRAHTVQLYFETSPLLAVNEPSQPVTYQQLNREGISYLVTGTIDQPYTERRGDGVRIDWGHLYVGVPTANGREVGIGDYTGMKQAFASTGRIAPGEPVAPARAGGIQPLAALSYVDNLGTVGTEGNTGFFMLGYDDVYAIEYFYKRRPAYWKHGGQVTIFDAFKSYSDQYATILERCRTFDNQLMAEAIAAGGTSYAELCALAYRQAIAAHKLIQDDEGNLLFLSKENNSNGCINTVDITYPSAPLFLRYNPDLLKGMLTPIFYYSESGRWKKPFPAHDLGTYPVANGQAYGEDMPVEEAGNMLILTMAIAHAEGNAEYARKHWETLTTWAGYLEQKGLDPDNQLCTDDFAGHLAHNANLSVKAITALACYGKLAGMLGDEVVAKKYASLAKTMAGTWQQMADDGQWYRLAFDREGTWSQKYNMVWDQLLELNVFDRTIVAKEVAHYENQQNKFGLPLDSRADYTKSDWILWTACLNGDRSTFDALVQPVWEYVHHTPSRVPLSDWHDTKTGKQVGFKARSVVGGYFMRLLQARP